MKNAIWLYFWLIIFEGALRKWVVPALSSPLLIIRDPVAIWILLQAIYHRLVKSNFYLISMVVIIGVSFITTLTAGHQNMFVALYGARIFLIHFPLIFVIADIFDFNDVLSICKAMVWLTPPMTLLIAAQFYSPQTAWINRGIGDQESGGFSGALGYFRPPATFSFTSGTSLFFSLAGACVLYFWFNASSIKKWLLIAATIGWLASIPLCISRTLFFQTAVTVLFLFIVVLVNSKYTKNSLILIVSVSLGLAILANFSFFQTAIAAFTSRYESANEVNGGVQGVFLDRFLGGMIYALQTSYDQPFFGYGIGYGTTVGGQLLTGQATFLISEEEWGRLIGELGPLMGLLVIFIRVGVTFYLAKLSFRQIVKGGDMLPWLLLSVGSINIAQGQWGPPTILGFSVFIGGLTLACFNKPADKSLPNPVKPQTRPNILYH